MGQTNAIELFKRALAQGTLSHAYLLEGPSGVGKMTLAKDLAKALNCQADDKPCGECSSCLKITSGQHPDIQVIGLNQDTDVENSRVRVEIGIERIRDLLRSASLPPFEGRCRVYIIEEASLLSLDAANCLLKTLEEPEEKVVFMLLTENPRQLPITIVSRCQRIRLSAMKLSELESYLVDQRRVEPVSAKLVARLSHGCPGSAIKVIENPGLLQERNAEFERVKTWVKGSYSERFSTASRLAVQFAKKRDIVYETMDEWLSWWHDLLLVKADCADNIINIDFLPALAEMAGAFTLTQIKAAVQNIREAGEQLRLNANARLVLEELMLTLPRPEQLEGMNNA